MTSGTESPGPRREPRVVTGQPSVALARAEFDRRFRARFADPAFDTEDAHVRALADVAWEAYEDSRKSPRTRPAGPGFADPSFELSIEWLEAREVVRAAQERQRDPGLPSRVLVVNGSARSDQTCPGEVSKTWRLARLAAETLEREARFEIDFLDLSRLASERDRIIFPCKACVSTAQPVCHWPCSCYPNHALGQVNDWMNEIYPLWAGAHGVLIVAPVNWYQAPSVLKLMMDRLVCADGGNADPTSTHGKDALKAKQVELAGWDYPKHLAGRAFEVVVHGDAAGVEELRRMLVDWLVDMELVPAGPRGGLDRYLGYYAPYATSHDELDRDVALQQEVRNAALTLAEAVRQVRSGRYQRPDEGLDSPREK